MRPAVLIANPRAGGAFSRKPLPRIEEVLREQGFAPRIELTRGPGDATRLARRAVEEGAEVVFALGGDGTFRETTKGLLGTDVPLGPLPAGTANVLARSLGLPRSAVAAARRIAPLAPRRLDVGLCGAEPFLMMASCGLDSRTVARVEGRPRPKLGVVSYLLAGLAQWWRDPYPTLTVEAAGSTHAATLALAANITHYAGPFRIAPGARPDDGRLDLLLFRGAGRAAAFGLLLAVLLGSHTRRADVELLPVSGARFAAPPGEPVQVDGDWPGLETPVEISLSPHRLRILAP